MRSVFISLIAVAALGTTLAFAGDSEQKRVAYEGVGLPVNSKHFHKSIMKKGWEMARSGYRDENAAATTTHTWMPWVAITGEGTAKIHEIELFTVNKAGKRVSVYTQRWDKNELIKGLQWSNKTSWFGKLLASADNLPIFSRSKDGAVVLNTTGKPDEVHQLLLSRNNRPTVPADTVKVGFSVKAELTGDAVLHGGLDCYNHKFEAQMLLRTPFYMKRHLDKVKAKLKGKVKVVQLEWLTPVQITEAKNTK